MVDVLANPIHDSLLLTLLETDQHNCASLLIDGKIMDKYEQLVGEIYDCAANPELWPDTLSKVRDHIGAAFVVVSSVDLSTLAYGKTPHSVYRLSPWDVE
jgi:hypothetical protein